MSNRLLATLLIESGGKVIPGDVAHNAKNFTIGIEHIYKDKVGGKDARHKILKSDKLFMDRQGFQTTDIEYLDGEESFTAFGGGRSIKFKMTFEGKRGRTIDPPVFSYDIETRVGDN